jgi:hypothetical protein
VEEELYLVVDRKQRKGQEGVRDKILLKKSLQ